ncbi:MAG TPA: protease modulator HflC [Spirochaetia bacterium]|nr:MAG: HflC protein [Spirochaetes bacterium GWB1_36_13]HCL58090.1 protease modulator HflC [Spirochaetia bacterium]
MFQSKGKTILFFVILFFLFITLMGSTFEVSETEQVIITQFGKPVGNPITEPGLHFKVPFIQDTHFFDKRYMEWDGDPNQITTKDKRYIKVDTYARWRISDPLLFFQRVRDERGAHTRLDDILDGETRNAIANQNLSEIVRSTNRTPQINEDLNEQENSFLKIEIGRDKIAKTILAAAALKTKDLGIELLDIRFKRINYIEEVQQKIFERMISERERIADKFRSEGQGEALKILGDKERELKKIDSEAYKLAQTIIGEADAEATKIFASAYNQSQDARDFYRFLKTMETYLTTLNEKDLLILSTKGDFFKYLDNKNAK